MTQPTYSPPSFPGPPPPTPSGPASDPYEQTSPAPHQTTQPQQAAPPLPGNRPPAPGKVTKVPQHTDFASTQMKQSGQVVGEKEVVEHTPAPAGMVDPRHVHVSLSATKNLGNYESVKVTIGVTRPCENTDAAEFAMVDEVMRVVHTRTQQELANS